MALSEEQIEELKEQLLEQINHFPEDKRESIKEKILSMQAKEFEEFLIQNNLIGAEGETKEKAQQCIFCLIAEGKVPSYKINENKENLAILELNPLSKGHALIVPKKHLKTEELPTNAFALAEKVAKKIKEKLEPKEIKISSNNIMGHSLVEVLPLYGNETTRKKAEEKDLIELKTILEEKPKQKREKKPKQPKPTTNSQEKPTENKPKLPKVSPRIP